jgi:hypothetical protein
MMWSMPDENGHAALVESSALGDGTWETPHSIGSAVNNGGNADYPFVMSDGVTLYYASDGEGSLGGYDIFISRREDNEFLAPQNVGMPYNSPYNDYLLAIDEVTGMGWWATDRNGIDGQVTIYKFIPSELRVNYDVDEPRLASYAKVASIRDTWAAGADYSAILNAVDGITTDAHTEAHDFELGFADGRRYTKWDDFHNAAARRKMEQYVDAREAFDEQSVELAGLRERYAGGDHSVQNRIMELEKHQLSDRTALRNILNEVFRLEQ